MFAIAIIGGTGSGKTNHVKELIQKVSPRKKVLIYDINREYSNAPLPTFEDFLTQAKAAKNTLIVLEEATIFFSNRSANRDVREILVRKRHTNVFLILVFHSLRTVPRDIVDLLDVIYLRKTNDSEDVIKAKFDFCPSILDAYKKIRAQKKPYIYETIFLR